jgi:hypothetical protein
MGTPLVEAMGDQEFRALLEKSERLLDRIRVKCNEIIEKVSSLISGLPGILVPDFVVEGVRAGIRKVKEVLAQLMNTMQEFSESPGWPPALFAAANSWLDEVARPAFEAEGKINSDRSEVDNYWLGSAKDAYKETLGGQQAAFGAMVDVARKIKECLHAAAWGVVKFWVAVGVALASAAGAIISIAEVVASLSGVVTAPAALLGIVGAIISVIVGITSAAWAVFVEYEGVKDQATNLREEREYNHAFDGEQWPKATAEGEWRAD